MEQHDANPFVRVARPAGLSRWIPSLAAVRTYQRPWLAKDLMAGLVLMVILVPVGMGYAEAAGLPAIYGLYATIVPLITYRDGYFEHPFGFLEPEASQKPLDRALIA